MSDKPEKLEKKEKKETQGILGTVLSYDSEQVNEWIEKLPISDETKKNIESLELDGYDLCFDLRDEQIDELTQKNEHEKNVLKREIENIFNDECK